MLVVLAVVAASGLVVASPLALRRLAAGASDWERLSWIGQTYGAASALLAMLALIGVTISLFIQAREAKATREQALRAIHTELLQMAMDDEVYRRCWGPFFASGDPVAQREHMYVNPIISNWQMRYELGAISEEHLRASSHILLSGEVGQRFWTQGRELRLRTATGRRDRRFHQILDEEYLHALSSPAQPPAPVPPLDKPSPPHRRGVVEPSPPRRWPVWVLAAGAAIAAVPIIRRLLRPH